MQQISLPNKILYLSMLFSFIGACFPMVRDLTGVPIFWPSFIILIFLLLLLRPNTFESRIIIMLVFFLILIGLLNTMNPKFSIMSKFLAIVAPILLMGSYAEFFGRLNNKRSFKIFIQVVLVIIAIRCVTGTIIEFIEPGTARHLTSTAGSGEELSARQKTLLAFGAAQYSFIHSLPFIVVPLAYSIKNTSGKSKKFLWVMLCLTVFMVVRTSWGAATIFTFALLWVGFFMKKPKNLFSIAVPVTLFILINSFQMEILNSLEGVVGGNEIFTRKVQDIRESLESGENSGDVKARVDLYELSLNTFLDSPLIGNVNGQTGGHAFWLDWLALYGILGTIPFIAIFYLTLKRLLLYLPRNYHYLAYTNFILYILIGFTKNAGGFDFIIIPFVVGPLIVYYYVVEPMKIKNQIMNNNLVMNLQ